MANSDQPAAPGSSPELFPPTLWTVVLQAAGADPAKAQAALGRLCELYYRPIRIWVRLRVFDPQATDDLTQQFIEHLMKPGRFAEFERRPGSKFRSYLVKALENFLEETRKKSKAKKRGDDAAHVPIDLPTEDGGARPSAPPADPAQVLDREVALAIHERVMVRLKEKFIKTAKQDRFDALKDFVLGGLPDGGFAAIALTLGLSANVVRQEMFRLRDDYYDFFRAEVAQIVGGPEKVDEEMRYLLSLLPEEYGPTGDEKPSPNP